MDVAIASTGAANLASVMALCARAGVSPNVTEDPEKLYGAEYAILPGVGAFAPAAKKLRQLGIDQAFRERFAASKFTMGICLGMQLMCESSEESDDMGGASIKGVGIVPGRIGRFPSGLPLPQLGWNRVFPAQDSGGYSFLKPGWAYFANSYRLAAIPDNFGGATSVYGESFAAALSYPKLSARGRPTLLLCQFHPELSGPYGLDIFKRWLGLAPLSKDEAPTTGGLPNRGNI